MTPYYEQDGITIYCGNALNMLGALPRDAALIFDPPYGISHASNHTCDTTTAAWMNQEIEGDGDTSFRDVMIDVLGSGPWACFGSIKTVPPAGTRQTLVWDKGPASGMGDLSFPWKLSYELIHIGGDGWAGRRDEGVLKGHWIVTRASMGRTHPNQKPESLMGDLIGKLPPGKMIIDPSMGSGTTIVAAKKFGHRAIGIDVRENYCADAVRRLAQGALFGTKSA
jgi:hypothetical protein